MFPTHTLDKVQCTGCTLSYIGSKGWLNDHLRKESSEACWPSVYVRFFTDCVTAGDNERDKLVVLNTLGLDGD